MSASPHTSENLLAGTWVLFLSLFLMLLGNGLQGSLLSIRGIDEGFGTITLALISAGFYGGYFAGSSLVPLLLKRVGYIRVFAALVAVASVTAVAYAMFINQYVWFSMRLITGFCFAGIYMISESWLNSQTHNDNRAKVLGAYIIVIYSGLAAGQLLLNVGHINGYFLFALASVIISLASVPLLLTNRPAPHIEESENMSVFKLYKRSPLGTVTTFCTNFTSGGIIGMAAIYAKTIALSTSDIALFVAAAFIGVILLQFPVGYFSDRLDRRKIIISLNAASALLAFYMMRIDNVTLLIGLFALFGGLSLPLYAVCIAYVNDRLKPNEILPATSALLIVAGMGNVLSPIIIGYCMVEYGSDWFFGCLAIVALFVVVFGLHRIRQRDNIDPEQSGDYLPIGANGTASTLSLAHEGIQLEFDFSDNPSEDPETTNNTL